MKRKILISIVLMLLTITLLFIYKKDNRYSFNKQKTNYTTDTIVIVDRDSDSNISLLSEIDISDTSEDSIKAKLYSDGVLAIVGTGRMKDNSDDSIWNNQYIEKVRNIIIGDGVTNIGDEMFTSFKNLEDIRISSTVSDIGFGFIADTNVSAITISEGNTYFKVEDGILFNKDKTILVCYPPNGRASYVIPNGVTTIREDAFICNLKIQTLEISSTVSAIEMGAFTYTPNLYNIKVSSNNQHFSDINGVLFNKDKTILIYYPNKVAVKKYIVPDGVVKIENGAFAIENDVEELILPDSLKNIEEEFEGCTKLKKITIPKNVISMSEDIFIGCGSIEEIYVYCGSYAEELIDGTMNSSKMKVIHTYENGICSNCGNHSTDKVVETRTLLDELNISETEDDDVKARLYDDKTLEISGIGNMKDNDENTIWNEQFINNTKYIIIDDGINNIGREMFALLENLESLTISSTVSRIGTGFALYTNLKRIEVSDLNPYFSSNNGVLFNKDKTNLICYPNINSEINYSVPKTVTELLPYAFSIDNSIKTLSLPNGLTTIGTEAFYGCRNIERITIPKTVTSMPQRLFSNLTNLEKIFVYCGSYADRFTKENNYSKNIEIVHTYENGICTGCGDISTDHTHTYGEWVITKKPTCTEEGRKQRICPICNEVETESIAKTEHSYPDVWTINKYSTVNEEGLKTRTCLNCGEIQQEVIPKLSSSELTVITKYNTKVVNGSTYIILPQSITVDNILGENNITSNKKLKIVNLSNIIQNNNVLVGTGFRVMSIDNELAYIIVVKGDVTGDGSIKPIDITLANSIRFNRIPPSKEQLLAVDFNEDGKINPIEITTLARYRLGTIKSLS